MKVKFLRSCSVSGHQYKAGDIGDVSDSFGALLVKFDSALEVPDTIERKPIEVEVATAEPETELAVKRIFRRKRK